jgi:hypothetical protein
MATVAPQAVAPSAIARDSRNGVTKAAIIKMASAPGNLLCFMKDESPDLIGPNKLSICFRLRLTSRFAEAGFATDDALRSPYRQRQRRDLPQHTDKQRPAWMAFGRRHPAIPDGPCQPPI